MRSCRFISCCLLIIIFIGISGCITTFAGSQDTISEVNPIEISGPVTIAKPGYYQIVQDIVPSGLKKDRAGSCMCINIKSSGVLIDGMGHIVDGRFTDSSCPYAFGFFLGDKVGNQLQYPNVIIKNVTATHWSSGILLSGAHEVRLEKVTLSDNKQLGLQIVSSSGVTVNQSTVIKNTGEGILSQDSENIIITHTLVAENSDNGIYMMGILLKKYPVGTDILGQKISLTELLVTEQKTSGDGYDISHNQIQNNKGTGIIVDNSQSDRIEGNVLAGNRVNGIALTNVDNTVVQDNTVSSSGRTGIDLRGCGYNLVLQNNTLSGNAKDTFTSSQKTDGLPPILFGTFLIVLLNVIAGTCNLTIKGGSNWIFKKVSAKYPAVEQKLERVVQDSRFSRFFSGSAAVSVAGAILFGGAFTYSVSYGMKPEVFIGLTFIGGIVTVVPKIIQYSFARSIGIEAAYRMWWGGILIMFSTTLLFRSVFGQPVRTEIVRGQTVSQKQMAVAMLAGPIVCILLAFVFFLLLLLIKGSFVSLLLTGVQMSLLSALVLLLPIAPMDGVHVLRWNKPVWAVFFFPVLLAYGFLLLGYIPFSYFTLANLLIAGIIGVVIGVLAVTGYYIGRNKRELVEHHFIDRISRRAKYLIISVIVFIIARFFNFFFAGLHTPPLLSTGSPLNNLLLLTTVVLEIGAIIVIIISIAGAILEYIQKSTKNKEIAIRK